MDEYNIIITDKDGKILTKDELMNKEIDIDAYYQNMALVSKRIKNNRNINDLQNNFDNGH